MANEIFISYSRKDYDRVIQVKSIIDNSLGIESWIDLEGIESSSIFEDVIIRNINSHAIMIFMLSKNSQNSPWAIKELNFAERKQKRIFLVNIDNCQLSDRFAFRYSEYDITDFSDLRQRNQLLNTLRKFIPVSPSVSKSVQNKIKPSTTQNKVISNTSFDFILPIEDVYYLDGYSGTVIRGNIERGSISILDKVEIIGPYRTKSAQCIGIRADAEKGFSLEKAVAGTKVDLLLKGLKCVNRNDLLNGTIVKSSKRTN